MAFTFSDGSATIGTTEYFLASASTTPAYQTTDCIMQAFIDLTNMAAGDTYRIKVVEKINSSASPRVIFTADRSNAQSEPGFVIPSLIVGDGWEVSVTKIAGTDRSIGWSIRKAT